MQAFRTFFLVAVFSFYCSVALAGTPPPPPTISRCDVNADGSVSSTDVGLMIDEVLGTRSCVSDLDGNGRCDAVDVQRVINAVQGQACQSS